MVRLRRIYYISQILCKHDVISINRHKLSQKRSQLGVIGYLLIVIRISSDSDPITLQLRSYKNRSHSSQTINQ